MPFITTCLKKPTFSTVCYRLSTYANLHRCLGVSSVVEKKLDVKIFGAFWLVIHAVGEVCHVRDIETLAAFGQHIAVTAHT